MGVKPDRYGHGQVSESSVRLCQVGYEELLRVSITYDM